METLREIWFHCTKCGRESYCDGLFDRLVDPEVMCPFCLTHHKLKDVRINC